MKRAENLGDEGCLQRDSTEREEYAESLKKTKTKLKELTSRSHGRNVRTVMQNVKVYIIGWELQG